MTDITVLIVDDLYENRLLLNSILTNLGVKVYSVENGQQALDFLDEHVVDMIFMDLSMPVMDGVEATKKIRTHTPKDWRNNIPIIAITAFNPRDFFKNYSHAGFNHLVSKPYTPEKIQRMINFFVEEDEF